MTIASLDNLINAYNLSETGNIAKASIANQLAGGYTSLWRATGQPTLGAIPGAAAIPTKATTGALMNFTNSAGSNVAYIGRMELAASVGATAVFIGDRLSHMGGLSGTVTTAQTVGTDVTTLINARCRSDYADVTWWLEIYTDIGTTGVTGTVSYTNAAGTAGQSTTVAVGGASPANRASRIFPIYGANGEFIRSIQTITLSVTTGTAGSFGITAIKPLTSMGLGLANFMETYDYAKLGMPIVNDDACLMGHILAGNATTGTVTGAIKLITG